MKSLSSRRRVWVFYAMCLGSLLFSVAYLAFRRGAGFVEFFYQGGTNFLGDFSNNLHYPTHAQGPYFNGIWASFPPLAYTIYYLVNVGLTRAVPLLETVVYMVITAGTFMIILYGVLRVFETYAGGSSKEAFVFTLCVLVSSLCVYTIERGNSALNVMALMLFPLYLRQSKQAWKREAALILIALAAGMKIYPSLLGIVYLLEKRYREALRLLVYGLVLFFVPFLWFGGMEGLAKFLENQQGIHQLNRNDFLTSIPSVARFLAMEWGWDMQTAAAVSQWVAVGFGALLLLGTALTEALWLRLLLLMSLAVLVPGWSAEYMGLYMALPCVLFLCRPKETLGWKDGVYGVLFGGIFTALPFATGFALHAPVSWGMLVSFASIYLITFWALWDVLGSYRKRRREALAAQ